MQILLVSDIHGYNRAYLRVLDDFQYDYSIQLGDMGYGFIPARDEFLHENLGSRDFFIRGNHDNPELVKSHPNYLGDYGMFLNTPVFYLSGALSIDRNYRIPGRTWWPEEQLDTEELHSAYEFYVQAKPRYVITHTAPASVTGPLCDPGRAHMAASAGECRTSKMLDRMFKAHQPEKWIFGHFHSYLVQNIDGCEFIALAALDHIWPTEDTSLATYMLEVSDT